VAVLTRHRAAYLTALTFLTAGCADTPLVIGGDSGITTLDVAAVPSPDWQPDPHLTESLVSYLVTHTDARTRESARHVVGAGPVNASLPHHLRVTTDLPHVRASGDAGPSVGAIGNGLAQSPLLDPYMYVLVYDVDGALAGEYAMLPQPEPSAGNPVMVPYR
jgi:hypothetical protein